MLSLRQLEQFLAVFWSRPEDVQAFAHDATHATSLKIVALPEATHFVHLDRPQRGRDQLLREISAFIAR